MKDALSHPAEEVMHPMPLRTTSAWIAIALLLQWASVARGR